jgi:F0F1-type ATP synthase membrane subunit b/b'
MTEVSVLLGVLGVLLLLGFAAGCGLVSDQTKQEAKKKVEAKGQQAKQEAKKEVEAKGQQVKQEVKKKVEAGKEDLEKKVDALEQQDRKK